MPKQLQSSPPTTWMKLVCSGTSIPERKKIRQRNDLVHQTFVIFVLPFFPTTISCAISLKVSMARAKKKRERDSENNSPLRFFTEERKTKQKKGESKNDLFSSLSLSWDQISR